MLIDQRETYYPFSMIVNQSATKANNWVLAATILASSMAILDGSALNVALPALQKSLNANATQLVWVVNAYALMLAALILVGGALGDHSGRKKIMMIGIGLFVVCSAACGAAPSVGWLIVFRTLQGIGGALLIPGSLAIITAVFDPKQRGKAIGTWSATGALMVIVGPMLGGVLADAGLWRVIFLLNIPLGLAALGIIYAKVPESRDETITGAVDYAGAGLASMGLAGLTYSFTMWSTLGPGNPAVYGTLLGGVVSLVLFVWIEHRQQAPLMPLSLFRVRTFAGTNLLTLFLYGALSVFSFFLSLNLIQLQGYRPLWAGFAFMPLPIPLILLSRWAGGLSDRYGPRLPLIIGPSLAGVGFFALSLVGHTQGPAQYWYTFLPGLLTVGFGMTITVVPLTNAVMGSVALHSAGTASGINNAVSRTAGVLVLAIAGSVALLLFRESLIDRTNALSLSSASRTTLLAKTDQLAATPIPQSIPLTSRQLVRQAIQDAFLDSYRVIMWGCAALAWLSAGMAAFWINSYTPESSSLDRKRE